MGSWYLVRHGETEWNAAGRIQGRADVPLSERGRLQMRLLAGRLAGREFSAVYASDLSRAVESARVIVGEAGSPVRTDADLREFCYGEWEGLTLEEVKARHGDTFAERLGRDENAFAAPGGEDSTEVLRRVRRFYAKTVEEHGDSADLLVVAHGGSIRALLVCLLGLADEFFWRFRVDCASLSTIASHPSGRVLELWNDTVHIQTADREEDK